MKDLMSHGLFFTKTVELRGFKNWCGVLREFFRGRVMFVIVYIPGSEVYKKEGGE